jgi:hypothetical protein
VDETRWTRLRRAILAGAAAATVLACLVAPAGARLAPTPTPKREVAQPQFVVPNLAAAFMCLAALAVPCKRFRRT